MVRFVISCIVEPLLTRRVNSITSTIIGIFIHEHVNLPWFWMSATHVTMSKPGNSWSSIPVTDTFLPVLSRTQTSAPAKTPLATLSTKDNSQGQAQDYQ